MEVVNIFYPNEYYLHTPRLGIKNEFNWALHGKKVWGGQNYYLQISSSSRFYGTESGETFLAKGNPKLLIYTSKFDPYKVAAQVKKQKLDGAVIIEDGEACFLPICSLAKFIFLPGILQVIDSPNSCPLIKFAKRNNSQLRSDNPSFPTCQEIDNLLKNSTPSCVCGNLYQQILN